MREARSRSPLAVEGREVEIRLAAVGDVMFGRYDGARRYRPLRVKQPFAKVSHLWKRHDIVMCNLETPITSRLLRKPYRSLLFRAAPRTAKVLRDAGFTVAVTANNHGHDQGDRGTAETIDHLAAAGLGISGTGKTLASAWAPYVLIKRGVKVAVLSVTILRNFPVHEQVGFMAFIRRRDATRELPKRVRAIRGAYDFLVLNLHFGAEYKDVVYRWDQRLMDRLQAAGVDVVFGHHPHVLRAVERRKGMAIFYSLGNFLFDFGMRNTVHSGVAQVTLVKQGRRRSLRRMRFVPVWRHWTGRPEPATGHRGGRVRRALWQTTHSLRLPNRFVTRGESVDIELGPHARVGQ
ncbi:MAG: CapA family protein [bacterium]